MRLNSTGLFLHSWQLNSEPLCVLIGESLLKSESIFQSIWEYEVRDNFRAEFIEAYSSKGLWVSLFEQCKGYIKTELKQDIKHPERFLTIDYWQSQSAFSAMKQNISDEYNELDKRCEAYTLSEKHIGFFSNE